MTQNVEKLLQQLKKPASEDKSTGYLFNSKHYCHVLSVFNIKNQGIFFPLAEKVCVWDKQISPVKSPSKKELLTKDSKKGFSVRGIVMFVLIAFSFKRNFITAW